MKAFAVWKQNLTIPLTSLVELWEFPSQKSIFILHVSACSQTLTIFFVENCTMHNARFVSNLTVQLCICYPSAYHWCYKAKMVTNYLWMYRPIDTKFVNKFRIQIFVLISSRTKTLFILQTKFINVSVQDQRKHVFPFAFKLILYLFCARYLHEIVSISFRKWDLICILT